MIDFAKLILLVDTADGMGINTEENYLHYYAFFAKEADVQFTYTFQVLDSLYSPMIHEDLSTLEDAYYIETGSGFHVTDKGHEWMEEFPREEKDLVQTNLSQYLMRFRGVSEIYLFKRAYAAITKQM